MPHLPSTHRADTCALKQYKSSFLIIWLRNFNTSGLFYFEFLSNFLIALMFNPWHSHYPFVKPFLLLAVPSSSVRRLSSFLCQIGESILYNNSVLFSIFLTKFFLFLISLLGFWKASFSIPEFWCRNLFRSYFFSNSVFSFFSLHTILCFKKVVILEISRLRQTSFYFQSTES